MFRNQQPFSFRQNFLTVTHFDLFLNKVFNFNTQFPVNNWNKNKLFFNPFHAAILVLNPLCRAKKLILRNGNVYL